MTPPQTLMVSLGPPTPRRPERAMAGDIAAKVAARAAARRCVLDFLTKPDHEERCVCDPPCSRDYDPAPPMLSLADRDSGVTGAESWAPTGGFYAGTGIGALYGGPMTSRQAADLAGWNIKPGSKPE